MASPSRTPDRLYARRVDKKRPAAEWVAAGPHHEVLLSFLTPFIVLLSEQNATPADVLHHLYLRSRFRTPPLRHAITGKAGQEVEGANARWGVTR